MNNLTPTPVTPAHLASLIDHTLLRPEATSEQIKIVCEEAILWQFCSVCVNGCHVPLVSELLHGSGVKTCSVIGFPLGAMSTKAKCSETALALDEGASEIDMVINVGTLREHCFDKTQSDIAQVAKECLAGNAKLKVILETALLSQEEKVTACKIAESAGADFVKTCTGFLGGGATVDDVALMRSSVGSHIGVKASGGIKDLPTALALVKAGATRLGCSASVRLVQEFKNRLES